jgi:uncharacterized protein
MILLIDAFNLTYKFPQLEEFMYKGDLAAARRGLLELLNTLQIQWKKPLRIHVFFDGKKMPGDELYREEVSNLKVYYSHDLSADYMIKEFVKNHPNPGEIKVVSSDKDIIWHTKKWKAASETSEEFAKWLTATLAEKSRKTSLQGEISNPIVTSSETAYWERMFQKHSKAAQKTENRKKYSK